jgi:hypothetical protein
MSSTLPPVSDQRYFSNGWLKIHFGPRLGAPIACGIKSAPATCDTRFVSCNDCRDALLLPRRYRTVTSERDAESWVMCGGCGLLTLQGGWRPVVYDADADQPICITCQGEEPEP